MAKKKRRPPRKRANNKSQVQEQLDRFERLLDSWVARSVEAAKKVETYRKKVSHYQNRLNAIERDEAEAAAATAYEAGRECRSIDLDGGDNV